MRQIMSFAIEISTASVLQEVCKDVVLEPPLQPQWRAATLLWESHPGSTPGHQCHPPPPGDFGVIASAGHSLRSASSTQRPVCHTSASCEPVRKKTINEHSKRREYEQRVRRDIEGASFVPLVFSTRGMGPACAMKWRLSVLRLTKGEAWLPVFSHCCPHPLPFWTQIDTTSTKS